MSTHLWSHQSVTFIILYYIIFISILQNPQRFHKASTRFHHFFTAEGLLLLSGFVCQSFAMNSLGGRQQVERHTESYLVYPGTFEPPRVSEYKQLFATDSSAGAEVTDNVVLFKSCLLETWTYSVPKTSGIKACLKTNCLSKEQEILRSNSVQKPVSQGIPSENYRLGLYYCYCVWP